MVRVEVDVDMAKATISKIQQAHPPLLKVMKALPKDEGRGKARINVWTAERLGCRFGDRVQLSSGEKEVVLEAWQAYPGDFGSNIIRLEQRVLDELSLKEGDEVEVLG